MIGHGNSLNYKNPLVIVLNIVCKDSLTPCLLEISYLKKFIDFIPQKRPIEDYVFY